MSKDNHYQSLHKDTTTTKRGAKGGGYLDI